ncbi:tetratricopeptide repeat protein [Novosphingobium aquimarinum]|uniref:tetratricopeptide repeat protein n=1 Tax=Novosphingobium aquimarinum TaxID=2682494 RepID=UPI0012EC1EF5|nr:tetratricopeptide repeat protein [Novosphingobium aquimarinum]
MKKALYPLVLLSLCSCGVSQEDREQEAATAYQRHDYGAARLHLVEALKGAPNDTAMRLRLARTQIALGDGFGAQTSLDQLDPKTKASDAWRELSAEAALLREEPEALAAALGSLQTVEAERLRAVAALRAEKGDEARAHFRKAIELGGSARAYADFGRFELMTGDTDAARQLAAEARKRDPEALDTLLLDGQLALRSGDLARALIIYDKAGKVWPGNKAALLGKASVLGDLGRYDEMATVMKGFESSGAKDPTVTYLRARLAAARNDWADVRKIVEAAAIDMGVRDPARIVYGEALLRLDQPQQAIAQLVPLVRAEPANRNGAMVLAEAQMAAGDPAAAVRTLRPLANSAMARRDELELMVKAARASKNPALAQYEAKLKMPAARALAADLADGDTAMRNENWAGAAEVYARVLDQTDGKNPMVLNNMAYAKLKLGDYQAADSYARRALKALPDNASVLDTAGWARFKLGMDLDEAKRLLRLAAQKAPENKTIRSHLAEAERSAG